MEIQELLGQYFSKMIDTEKNQDYCIKNVDALSLFCSRRIDLVSKYLLLLFSEQNIASDYALTIYKRHLLAFNNGKFSEPGNPDKNSFEKYLDTFYSIYNDLKKNGFDKQRSIIPAGEDGVIIDGGHRVAASAFLGTKLPVAFFSSVEGPTYNCSFFAERGMKEDDIDFLVDNYCKLKNNIYVCCVWPKIYKRKDILKIEEILQQYCSVVYKKSTKMTYNGLRNLQILTYGHQEWVGSIDDGFSNIDSKTSKCFRKGFTHFYIIESNSLENVIQVKEIIRNLFKMGKHSIHITDTQQEAREVIDVVLNNNSLVFNNYYGDYTNVGRIKTIRSIDKNTIFYPGLSLLFFNNTNCKSASSFKVESYPIDIHYDTRNYFFFDNKKMLAPQQLFLLFKNELGLSKPIVFNKNKNNRLFALRLKYKCKRAVVSFLKKTHLLNFAIKIKNWRKHE